MDFIQKFEKNRGDSEIQSINCGGSHFRYLCVNRNDIPIYLSNRGGSSDTLVDTSQFAMEHDGQKYWYVGVQEIQTWFPREIHLTFYTTSGKGFTMLWVTKLICK